MSRSSSLSISATTSPMRSALGLRRPTTLSQRPATPSSPSIAFRLPRRVANIIRTLMKTARVGICGLGRESLKASIRSLHWNTFSM